MFPSIFQTPYIVIVCAEIHMCETLKPLNISGVSPLSLDILRYNIEMSVVLSAVELTILFCYAVWGCLIQAICFCR
jgi:hypothetical protein